MVFPGRFSTGCLRCRQRKIKCDENKPSCQRCHIYGKACPGYTDQFHFRHSLKSNFESAPSTSNFISITAPTQSCKSQRQRIRKKRTNSQEHAAEDQAWPITLCRPMEASYNDMSLCYFVRRFVSPDAGDDFPGHLSFLPDLYDHNNPGLLETTTMSVAQMAAYNRFGGERFRELSYKNYGRAIRMMQETLKSEDQLTDDKVITAILLLCTFKDVSGEGLGDPNEHAPGLFYLLERRGVGQIATRRGAELFLLALLRLQIYSFLHEDDTYSDPGAMATVLGFFNPLIRAMSMMSRTLSLRHRLLQYMPIEKRATPSHDNSHNSPDGILEDRQSVIEACFTTLDEFDAWDAEAAAYWQDTFEGRAVPTVLGEVALGTTHYDAETACIIILIRSARLTLLLSMLLYHAKMQLAIDDEYGVLGDKDVWAACVSILKQDVRKTIDDILSIVPYALGDVNVNGLPSTMEHDGAGAIIIVQSIRLVTYCGYASSDQFEKANSVLNRMNATMGIRSAIGFGEDGNSGPRWAEEQALLRSMSLSSLDDVPFRLVDTNLEEIELGLGCLAEGHHYSL